MTKNLICTELGFTSRKYHKLRQRMMKNDITVLVKRRGRTSKVTNQHIKYLQEWFLRPTNLSKPFKFAYKALTKRFKDITIKERACYNQFKLRSGFSFKRIYRQKVKYNEDRTKELRVEYVSIFSFLFIHLFYRSRNSFLTIWKKQ